MPESSPVAKISTLTGTAFSRQADGRLIPLKPGDVLKEGDVVVTSPGGKVELEFSDGSFMQLDADQSVRMTSELIDFFELSVNESALSEETSSQVLESFSERTNFGFDGLSIVGRVGSTEEDGNNFVRLLRIVEGLEPASLDFEPLQRIVEVIDPVSQGLDAPQPVALREFDDFQHEVPPPDASFNAVLSLSGPASVVEGNLATYTLSVNLAPTSALNVDVVTGHMTTDDGDLVPQITTVTIPAGSTSVTFDVVTIDDVIADNGEQFKIIIDDVSGGGYDTVTVDDDTVVTTIIDDTGTPNIPGDGPEPDHDLVIIKLIALDESGVALTDGSGNYLFANEGIEGSVAQYMAVAFAPGETTFSAATQLADQVGDVEVTFTDNSAFGASAPSATDGSEDFNNTTQNVSLGTAFSVAIVDDVVVDVNEDFTATITDGSYTGNVAGSYENVVIGAGNSVVTTIIDNDVAINVTYDLASTASINEDAAVAETATFTLSLGGDALTGANTSSVVITPSGSATSGTDYDNFVAAVTTAAGAAAGVTFDGTDTLTFTSAFNGGTGTGDFVFTVDGIDDSDVEGTETIIGTLSGASIDNGSATIGTASSTTNITETDVALSLDLDANDDNDSGNTVNYQTVFANGGAGVALADTDVDLVTGSDISTLTLTVGGILDGADETIVIDGSTYALNADSAAADTAGGNYRVTVSNSGLTFVITGAGGAVMTKAEVESLLSTEMLYRNLSATPATGDRTVDIIANDGTTDTNSTTATVAIGKALTVSDPAAIDEGKSTVFIIDLSDVRTVPTVLDLSVGGDVDTNDYNTTLYYNNGLLANGQIDWQVATGDQVTIAAGDTRVEVKITTIQNDDDNADGDNDQNTGTVDPTSESISLTATINNYLEMDMANTSDTGSTVINDYPSLIVSAPVFVTEGNDAIFEVTLSAEKTDTTDVVLSLGGEIDTSDYDTTGYEYSTDDGATWTAVVGDIEGATVTIPLSTTDGGVDDRIQSVLVKITTLANDDAPTPDVDEKLVLTATTTDAGVANANTAVSDDTLIVESIAISTNEDTAQTLSGPAGYTYSILGQGANGTVEDDGAGTLTYTPDTDLGDGLDTHFSGTDSFSIIKTNDATGISTTAIVDVTVTAVADQPPITISLSDPVGDPPDPTEYVLNGSFESYTNPTGTDPLTLDKAGVDLTNWTFDTDGNDPLELYLTGGTSGITGITDSYTVDTSGSAKKNVTLTQVISGLTSGETYTISFDYAIPVGGTGVLNVNWDDGSGGGFVNQTSVDDTTATTSMQTVTVDVVAGATNTLQFLADNTLDSGGGDATGIYLDNVSIVATTATTYTYNVDIETSLVDADGSESLQDLTVTIAGIPTGSNPVLKSDDGTPYAISGVDSGSGDQTFNWTVPADELAGLKLTVNQPAVADAFDMTASVTTIEASNSDTASNSATASAVAMPTAPVNDVPVIGDNTLIMANESGFVGSVTDTIETYFSTDGGNTFSWDAAGSTLPRIFSEGQLVNIVFDDLTGTVTGTIDGGATTVFSVVVNMQDNDLTDITYNQPNELLGIEEIFDGGIVLPGGGNNDTIVLGFNDSGGNPSNVDAIIVAHNLIEDTAAEIASPTAEHTVNTNNYYIGVDSNNMNAGDQLIMDFATVTSDGSGNTSHANDVSQMEISLFNFGSEKSGDELYITVLTENPAFPGDITNAVRETVILTGDPDLHEMKYTVTAPSGGTFIGVEFLAGNESSFKLGIESISSISYNTDFDMTLGYDITDVDGDSDGGTVTISLDGDEIVIYDATKDSIDAGDEQTAGGGAGDDILILNPNESIDFATIADNKIQNFEIIDLTVDSDGGNTAHTLDNITHDDVVGLTDAGNTLKIRGDVADIVNLQNDGNTWSLTTAGELNADGHTYDVYDSTGGSKVYVESAMTGSFIDAPIIGLHYETASGLSGSTNANGGFSYISGDIVTFKLGSLVLGVFDTSNMANDGQLFLQDLAGVERTNLTDDYVTNLAVLLQSIDENSIAEDGLVITDAMHQAFADDAFNLKDLSAEQIVSLIDETGREAVSEEEAMAHVRDELIERTSLTEADFAVDPEGPQEIDLAETEVTNPDDAGVAAIAGDLSDNSLVGGIGVDVFRWELAERGTPQDPATDALNGFDLVLPGAGGDKLDLRDLLVGEQLNEQSGEGNLADYLHFEQQGDDTVVHVSSHGGFAEGYQAGQEDRAIVMEDVDLVGAFNADQEIIRSLVEKGKILTD